LEERLKDIRLMGDAVIAAFFVEDKPKAREKKRAEVESWLGGSSVAWDRLAALVPTLKQGAHPLTPFHWEIEFPEVFEPSDPGFDAIVGNPPFAGKNTISAGHRANYLRWLQTLHAGAHGNADLVAHFFRRAFALIRRSGTFGLIATKTIGQGDTRDTGLAVIIRDGGGIIRATRRLKWPGEASVTVSVVHVAKRLVRSPILDGRQVRRISAYLVEGDLDQAPALLAANAHKAFVGSYVLGTGFTFDDVAAAKGETESLDTMRALIAKEARNADRIFPYIGGEEVNTSPIHAHHRYVIDFADYPLRRDPSTRSWASASESDREAWLRDGIVPLDYPGPVAADWPDLLEIVERRVKGKRASHSTAKWWHFERRRGDLYAAIAPIEQVLVRSLTSAHFTTFAFVNAKNVFDQTNIVWSSDSTALLAALTSRTHEIWGRYHGATLEDRGRYNIADCFETYPFPRGFETLASLKAVGRAVCLHRTELMVARNEGMTKTYNRFHDPSETNEDIERLRELHAAMDRAVLEAYAWHDLASRAAPIFLDETNEDDPNYQGRLFWPTDFRDEVLANLLALNAERHEDEVDLGIAQKVNWEMREHEETEVKDET
jgi:hypothetical protein